MSAPAVWTAASTTAPAMPITNPTASSPRAATTRGTGEARRASARGPWSAIEGATIAARNTERPIRSSGGTPAWE